MVSPTPVSGAGSPLPSNQFGVSHLCSESQQLLPERPSWAAQGHATLAPLVGPGAEVGASSRAGAQAPTRLGSDVGVPQGPPTHMSLPVPRAAMHGPSQLPLRGERLPSHVGMRAHTCAASSPGACSPCPFQLGVAVLPHERLRPWPQVSSWAGLVTFLDLPVA